MSNSCDSSTVSSLTDNDSELEQNIELFRILSTLSQSTSYIPFIDTLDDDEIIELTTTIYEMIDDYLKDNTLLICEPDFHSTMEKEITQYLLENWQDAELCENIEDDDDSNNNFRTTLEFVKNTSIDYFQIGNEWCQKIPIRSTSNLEIKVTPNKQDISKIIDYLRSVPQPEQRTSEWYKFRHELITASNVGKIFCTEASRNSLIYEKCQPLKEVNEDTNTNNYVNILSPLHWGQKYEPLSVMLYEDQYNTSIEDFGCIQHEKYSFIGASPDGINNNPQSSKYGRMLEIKNIVNREINGIPSKLYWIQMQIQMESCNLDYCDFLETQFKEFESEEQFYENNNKTKGVILHFIERISIGGGICTSSKTNEIEMTTGYQLAQQTSGVPKYVYMPLDIELTRESIEQWIEMTRNKMRRSWSLYSIDYWYLEKQSCVLVERNKQWFEKALPLIEETWKTILKERETGYEHRAAKKKVIKSPGLEIVPGNDENSRIIRNLPVAGGVCLVKLNPDELKE
jgi:putative phage-type endonuclease